MCRFHKGGGIAVGDAFRLSPNVIPKSYKLSLAPDLAAATFSGEVTIAVNVKEATDEIVLNAIELEIQDALIARADGTSLSGKVTLDNDTQRAHIKVSGTVGKGDWNITLRFTGILNDKLRGFYRSTYEDEAGQTQVIATTQFQASDARRCFPCFDEPAFKATFEIALLIDKELVAVSNGSVVNVSDHPSGKKLVQFAPTMKMSTYLVAFVVGKLNCTHAIEVDGVAVRFWCVPGKEKHAAFPLEAAQFALRYFTKFFGVPYPSDKLDLLAVPDFAAGAMENFGCIIFRESVLVDTAVASQSSLDWSVHVVTHEIAHMWFGDLVTMEWWEGIWLNETFATLMENKCTDAFKREWKVWDAFGLSRESAFEVDALKSTRSIEYVVQSPDDAAAMLDVLTYEKGCSVMRMLEQFLGEETFQKSIALYISTHLYGNTKTTDLWAALDAASEMPVSQIMHGWIYAGGFPVVSIKLAERAGSVVLSQQSFKYLSDGVDLNQRWMIPVMLRAKTAAGIVEVKHLLAESQATVHLGDGLEWVVVNAGGHGFYRSRYSNDLQARLTANVDETLSVIERVNLLSDAWACVESGLSNSLEYIELIKVFANDIDPNVWSMITGPLATMRGLLPKGQRGKIEALCRDLLCPLLDRLGWEPKAGEASQLKELRGSVVNSLAFTGNDEAVHVKARQLYTMWLADSSTIDGDIIGPVIDIVAAKGGDQALHDEFYRLYKSAQTNEEEVMLLSGLASFQDLLLAQRSMELCLDANAIRTQDSTDVLSGVLAGTHGTHAWAFVKEHWDALLALYPEGMMVYVIRQLDSLDTPEQESDVQAFFESHTLPGAGKQLDQALEQQHIAVLLRQREAPIVLGLFATVIEPAETAVPSAEPQAASAVDLVAPSIKS